MCRSVPQIDATLTLTRTSVRPKPGILTSRTSTPGAASGLTTASMLLGIPKSFLQRLHLQGSRQCDRVARKQTLNLITLRRPSPEHLFRNGIKYTRATFEERDFRRIALQHTYLGCILRIASRNLRNPCGSYSTPGCCCGRPYASHGTLRSCLCWHTLPQWRCARRHRCVYRRNHPFLSRCRD